MEQQAEVAERLGSVGLTAMVELSWEQGKSEANSVETTPSLSGKNSSHSLFFLRKVSGKNSCR